MLATRERAQQELVPYRDRIVACLRSAITDFLRESGPQLAFIRKGTQANLLRDYIVRNIRAEFPDGIDGIRHSERHGLFLLQIGHHYALRFKKLDRRLRSRNIPTQLSLDFLLQQPLTLFPELDAVTHLNVGYQHGLTLATSTYWITCPNGDRLEWKFSISPELVELPVQREERAPRLATARAKQAPAARADGFAD